MHFFLYTARHRGILRHPAESPAGRHFDKLEVRMAVVVAEWHLVGKYAEDDGTYTKLRVVKHDDGTGNVYHVRPEGETKWFVDTVRFEHEPEAYLDGVWYHVTQVK